MVVSWDAWVSLCRILHIVDGVGYTETSRTGMIQR